MSRVRHSLAPHLPAPVPTKDFHAPESDALVRRIHLALENDATPELVSRLLSELPHRLAEELQIPVEEVRAELARIRRELDERIR